MKSAPLSHLCRGGGRGKSPAPRVGFAALRRFARFAPPLLSASAHLDLCPSLGDNRFLRMVNHIMIFGYR
ncbi:hypothetical protein HMPREF7215_1597 [Pyramidobacter piscolens W5455]|uniref:Uncharacterized protein n=1 Tax=Pyramidobacter piscolens W5455 TaxID=352165 RepID=A0ABM9ZSN7_9BACT|nr:hypothetical protein HMPREF7215_1597 [Pyramidobacter piscolens W5455]